METVVSPGMSDPLHRPPAARAGRACSTSSTKTETVVSPEMSGPLPERRAEHAVRRRASTMEPMAEQATAWTEASPADVRVEAGWADAVADLEAAEDRKPRRSVGRREHARDDLLDEQYALNLSGGGRTRQ